MLLIAGIQSSLADGQSAVHPALTNDFYLDIGVYYPEREVMIRANGSVDLPRPFIDFRNSLSHKNKDETFAMNFGWRFSEKWQLMLQYFSSGGSQQVILDKDVPFGDLVFQAGSNVRTATDFSLVRMFFAREFAAGENQEFGFGAGLHWLEMAASIQGALLIDGEEDRFARESVRVSAPLPNIGVWYTYSISPKWAAKGRIDWLSADIEPYDGTLINASLGVNYQMFKNAGIGLSYNYFKLDVGISDSNWQGGAKTKYEGLFAYLSFYW